MPDDEKMDDPILESREPHQPPGSGHHLGPGSRAVRMAEASATSVDVCSAVRDQGQESQLMDQEQRSDNGTEDATIGSTLGSRTGGELLEVPDAGFPARYLWHDGRPYPTVPEIPLLLDGRPVIGHLERIEPETLDTPTAVYGFPAGSRFLRNTWTGQWTEPFDLPSTYIRGTTVIVRGKKVIWVATKFKFRKIGANRNNEFNPHLTG